MYQTHFVVGVVECTPWWPLLPNKPSGATMLPSDFAQRVVVPDKGGKGRYALPEERSQAGRIQDLIAVGMQIGVSLP